MTIHYFNLTASVPTRDNIYLKALSKQGHRIEKFTNNSPGLKKFREIKKQYKNAEAKPDLIWVGYTGYLMVPWLKLIVRGRIFFNAYSSLYEGMIISRKAGSRLSLVAIKYWLIDFISFHLADVVSAETEHQKSFLHRFFWLPKKKIVVVMTGADDEFFCRKDSDRDKLANFTVVFRGGFLPEAGVPCLIEAIKVLSEEKLPIRFRIIGFGIEEGIVRELIQKYNLTTIELITENKKPEELRDLMSVCHLSLGQLADHPRLERTIPHKAFETLALGLPYLTARTAGILELLEEGRTCLCFKPGDPVSLAGQISRAYQNQKLLSEIAESGYVLYKERLRSETLSQKLLRELIKSR